MKSFLSKTYKSIIGSIEDKFTKLTPIDDLVVVCMHSTPKQFNIKFEELIHWIRRRYTVINPTELSHFLQNPRDFQRGPYLLFTFDDGLKNNLNAARLLEKHGISGVFFVVPEFIESLAPKEYYRTNIRPEKEHFELTDADTTPMSWEDIVEIKNMGHSIGSHTMTHGLKPSLSEDQILFEIETSAITIAQKIQQKVDFFASPNNTLESVDQAISKKIRETYPFHFTTVPGLFRSHKMDSHLIYRRNIEVHWKSKGIIAFALGSFDLRRWRAQRNALSQR